MYLVGKGTDAKSRMARNVKSKKTRHDRARIGRAGKKKVRTGGGEGCVQVLSWGLRDRAERIRQGENEE